MKQKISNSSIRLISSRKEPKAKGKLSKKRKVVKGMKQSKFREKLKVGRLGETTLPAASGVSIPASVRS